MKFRKKPVVIDAVQWNGSNICEILALSRGSEGFLIASVDESLTIQTLEGEMVAIPGDWIIRGIKGELYPCKPDIFSETYEKVENDD